MERLAFSGRLYLQSRRMGQGQLRISGDWSREAGLYLALRTPLGGRLGELEVRTAGEPELHLADEELRSLLFLVEEGLPGRLLKGELRTAEELGPWFWGDWQPSAEAVYMPAGRSFARGDTLWQLDSLRAVCSEFRTPELVVRCEDFRRSPAGRWLPSRIRITEEHRSAVISWKKLDDRP